LNIQENGIEIKNNFLPLSIIQSVTDDVSIQLIDMSRYGIRSVEKKFHSIGELVSSGFAMDISIMLFPDLWLKDEVNNIFCY
jgi:hypothetical protein